ncbi:hypothetical protein EVAR_83022_1 [Eumeta japonica]|uniref:Uncharacterized protein n=1 Tax=Eumeta variegata TaxID=151549 RepID=A0A4C1T2Z7_EUMVA|nr:hypothetical protein EVAR_83022_1 [Eumeta japonica]
MLSTERKIPLVVWKPGSRTPPVVNVINAAANQAGIPRREGVADDAARTTLPDRVQPGSVARREHSSERGRGLAELADAINKLARPRPIPRQVYELPSFHGNVNDAATDGRAGKSPHRRMSPTAANSKPEDIMAALEKKFGRPELVDEVLKEVKVMSRLTDSGREINDFAITTRNCVAVLQEIDEEATYITRERGSSGGQADRTSRLSGEEAELAAVYARAAAALVHNKTHPRAYCRAKGCAKCNRGHHTLLHPSTGSDARPARAAPNESAVSETVTNIGTGPRAELKLISARGHQISDRNSRRIKIKVRGPNGVERDIQCRTITRLDLPSQSLTADEISSHHHLNECHLEALRDARPLLLIGQDNWNSSPAATSGVENQVSQSRL